jgi:phosphoribosyl 1,2-cyclic phosphodiesterase
VRITIWGCRGSIPTPGPATVRYGGNTSCVEVILRDGSVLVLDAGTGIRSLGLELERRGTRRIHLFLTHLHLDHLEGLRFFEPLWDERVELDIWGPPSPTTSLRARIARTFSPPLFPVDLRDVPARLAFHDVPREPWAIGGASLTATFVVHPGPTVGYRIESATGTLAYIPDHEPALAGSITGRSRDWISGASLAAGADVLLHDAQYSEDEYPTRAGWGHSSVADAVAFTGAAGARRLVLFHHDPGHSDASLEHLEARARSLSSANGSPEPALAHEGMVLDVG